MANVFTKVVANFITTLATSISVGGTTATLQGNTTKDGATLPNGRYCFTVNQGKSNEQHFVCTLTGTAITGIQAVDRLGNTSTGAAKAASINDEVKITDFVNLKWLVDDVTYLNSVVEDIINSGAPDASTVLKGVARLSQSPNTTLGTVTMTIATPAVATLNGHGLTENDSIEFSTTGALPTGVTAGLKYYVLATGLTANDFQFSTAPAGTAVNTSGSQSGVHTLTKTTPVAVSTNDPKMPTANEKAAMGGSAGVPSSTNKFLTEKNLYTEEDQSQKTQNTTAQFGQANSTGNRNKQVQSFTAQNKYIRGVKLYKLANVGTFTGTVTIELQSDNAGSPSGTVLATQTISNAFWSTIPVGEFFTRFPSEVANLTIGGTYWIVVSASTADNSNYPNLGANSAGGYSGGSSKYWNTTDGYVANSFDLYFATVNGVTGMAVPVLREIFAYSATWAKPVGAKAVLVTLVAGGGGGGGAGNVNGATGGGGGGGGGGISQNLFNADSLGATVDVTVGAGGAGGAGKASGSTGAGVAGTTGGDSSFGTHITAKGGGGGGASLGTGSVGGTGGTGGFGNVVSGSNGGAGGTTGAPGIAGTGVTTFAPTGGGGGGSSGGGAGSTGGAGGARSVIATLAGGTGGNSSGSAGGAGNTYATNETVGGTGGGGGGGDGNNNVAGGNGGAGGSYGAGGGGGGATYSSTRNSGSGANGANGIVIVITYF